MADWNEPKSDYVASDQVTPNIFNTLGENEKHLKEIKIEITTQPKTGTEAQITRLVLVEV